MPKFVDITGKLINRLTIVSCAGMKPVRWLCRCDCGNELIVKTGYLNSGNTKSCGCLNRDAARSRVLRHGKHGTSEYNIWQQMRYRCGNSNHPHYRNYGGRGIRVCDRWQSFDSFYADMGPRPLGLSLDRIDNDGNYELTNCRWATRSQQNKNQRPRKRPLTEGMPA